MMLEKTHKQSPMKTQSIWAARRSGTKSWLACPTVKRLTGADDCAFTRTELLATLAALFLLGAVALPLLASSKPRSERVLCLNNLRQIGVAMNLRATETDNLYHWRVPVANGGVSGHAQQGNTWFQFAWVSNELATPRILMCPADKAKKLATSWGIEDNGGFLHASYRNLAASYGIGLDAFSDNPNHVLSGDRNMDTRILAGCSAGPTGVPTFLVPSDLRTKWTHNIHFSSGNALFTDGRALELSNKELREAINAGDDNGSIHFLLPN